MHHPLKVLKQMKNSINCNRKVPQVELSQSDVVHHPLKVLKQMKNSINCNRKVLQVEFAKSQSDAVHHPSQSIETDEKFHKL